MCLSRVLRGDERQRVLRTLPKTFYVWKYLNHYPDGWFTAYSIDRVCAGQRKAPYLGPAKSGPCGSDVLKGKRAYRSGWHAIVSNGRPGNRGEYNTRCVARKRHVREIGWQGDKLCVVLSHITFPRKCGAAPKGGKR